MSKSEKKQEEKSLSENQDKKSEKEDKDLIESPEEKLKSTYYFLLSLNDSTYVNVEYLDS